MFKKTIVVQHWRSRSADSMKRLKCLPPGSNSSFLAMLIAQMIQRSIINLSSEMCIRKCRAESGWVIVWYSGGVDARLSPHMVLHPWLCIIEEKTWTKSTKSASFVWWDMLPLFLNFFKSSFFQERAISISILMACEVRDWSQSWSEICPPLIEMSPNPWGPPPPLPQPPLALRLIYSRF